MIQFTRKRILIAISCLILAAIGGLAIFISRLPTTPQEEFTYETGYPWPSYATLIEIKKDYHHGFKTEGTTTIHVRTSPNQIQEWLSAKPPFGQAWMAGADTMLSFEIKDVLKTPLQYCTTGDMGNGQSLTVDPTTGDAWYYHWQW